MNLLDFNEKEAQTAKIGSQHLDYYKQVLSYLNDHESFIQSIENEKTSKQPVIGVKRVLETKPKTHFGEADSRLQSLLFMLRENEDVFSVFCSNLYRIGYEANGTFPETIVNFLFNDLVHTKNNSSRFQVVLRSIIGKEVEIADTPD